MTHTEWEAVTAEELQTAAKVARTCGGEIMHAAADAWEKRSKELGE